MKKFLLLNAVMMMVMTFGAHAAFGTTIKLAERGVTVGDNSDDSSAVQAAVNELLHAGGGTLEFPAGVIDIKREVRIVPAEYKPVNIIFKGDGGSVVRVSVGSSSIAFYTGNLNRFQIEEIVFTGMDVPASNPKFTDARIVIFAGWVSTVKVLNSSFFGLAVPDQGAIIHASANLIVDNCQFDGNNAGYPNGAVINLDCCSLSGQNALILNTTFLDYTHFNGQYLSKSHAFTGSWIRAKQMYYGGDTTKQRLIIDNTMFDEGAAWGVQAENIGTVQVRNSKFNINGSIVGTGVKARNVKRVRIEDSHFGWATQTRPLAILDDTTAEMIGLTRSQSVQCPQSGSDTNLTWRLSDCK